MASLSSLAGKKWNRLRETDKVERQRSTLLASLRFAPRWLLAYKGYGTRKWDWEGGGTWEKEKGSERRRSVR